MEYQLLLAVVFNLNSNKTKSDAINNQTKEVDAFKKNLKDSKNEDTDNINYYLNINFNNNNFNNNFNFNTTSTTSILTSTSTSPSASVQQVVSVVHRIRNGCRWQLAARFQSIGPNILDQRKQIKF
ncbi:hypothetical protein ACTA71_000242 [Dictyostelium dimigraforme]